MSQNFKTKSGVRRSLKIQTPYPSVEVFTKDMYFCGNHYCFVRTWNPVCVFIITAYHLLRHIEMPIKEKPNLVMKAVSLKCKSMNLYGKIWFGSP